MIIGTFTKNENGAFEGQIQTFNLSAALTLVAINNPNEKGPHYRVLFSATELEAGAGWVKTSQQGKDYLSLKLDGPTLDHPIYAAMTEENGQFKLNWSRPKSNTDADRVDPNSPFSS